MKSIVLCESTLVNQSEESKENLKGGKVGEDNEKTKEKKIINGASTEESESEFAIDSTKENEESLQNGEREFPEGSREDETSQKNQKNCESTKESVQSSDTSEKDTSAQKSENALCSNVVTTDSVENVQSLSDNEVNSSEAQKPIEVVKISDAQSSVSVVDLDMEKPGEVSEVKSESCEESMSERVNEEKSDLSSTNDSGLLRVKEDISSRESLDLEGNITSTLKENLSNESVSEQAVEDLDENKENKKEEENSQMHSPDNGDEPSSNLSSDVQVDECQIVSDSEKDLVESESKKAEGDPVENLGEKESSSVEESRENENDEEMRIEEEPEQSNVENLEMKEIETDLDVKSTMDIEENEVQPEAISTGTRKRHISEFNGESSCKRKRLSQEEDEEGVRMNSEKNDAEDSVLESSPSLEAAVATSEDKKESVATKRPSPSDLHPKKPKAFKGNEEEEKMNGKAERVATATSSFLANFRGSLKSLTRGDLEELIVQKLCEVITERSTVGELRRKAQALEQDQERWKVKVQSLTKQMTEMEMVMKKYMSEVQKQLKDGDPRFVTPLKVTRTVGLQVSYSDGNKAAKVSLAQAAVSSSAQNQNGRFQKAPPPPKLPPRFTPHTQNPAKNKPAPPSQKSSPSPQKSTVNQQKKPPVSRSDYPSTPPNGPVVLQSLLNNSRGPQNQAPGGRSNSKTVSGACQQQQPQQQQQNGSKVIDLTEDDDRQTGNVVKAPGSIRVVNNLSQSTVPQNNRFAYLLPTTSTSTTGTSGGQSRQVLIATPTMPQSNRQLVCPMPPLLFKGGNVVQSGSPANVVKASNRVLLPKTLRHPAPLPQPPLNQNNRPNLKLLPPRPALKISKVQTGIVLSWNMSLGPEHAPIASYQLYAYQESNSPPATSLWKKVGDVKALPLPMACTLTQFMSGHKYHFAVRAVDLHSRIGPFSYPGTIVLIK